MDPSAQQAQAPAPPVIPTSGGGISKEVETGKSVAETPRLKEIGVEAPLAPEVAGAGVKLRPTTVTIPPKVSQMGVGVLGQTKVPQSRAVALPLTDVQIAQGLTQSVSSSWRWLAEWCRRRLKQLQSTFKAVGGKK